MIKKEWHFILKPMNKKRMIQKLQQMCDKLPKGKERKNMFKKLIKLKTEK